MFRPWRDTAGTSAQCHLVMPTLYKIRSLNRQKGVGMSADAARKSACATMDSTVCMQLRKLSDVGHECPRQDA